MRRTSGGNKTWNAKLPEMPVDARGNWISYPGYDTKGWEVVHQPFFAVMTIDGMHVGRSAKNVILKDVATDKTYPMFIADLVSGIQNGTLAVQSNDDGQPGTITAYWTGSKRGQNYGIKAVNVPG